MVVYLAESQNTNEEGVYLSAAALDKAREDDGNRGSGRKLLSWSAPPPTWRLGADEIRSYFITFKSQFALPSASPSPTASPSLSATNTPVVAPVVDVGNDTVVPTASENNGTTAVNGTVEAAGDDGADSDANSASNGTGACACSRVHVFTCVCVCV